MHTLTMRHENEVHTVQHADCREMRDNVAAILRTARWWAQAMGESKPHVIRKEGGIVRYKLNGTRVMCVSY